MYGIRSRFFTGYAMDEGLIHSDMVEMLVSLKSLTCKDPVDLQGYTITSGDGVVIVRR